MIVLLFSRSSPFFSFLQFIAVSSLNMARLERLGFLCIAMVFHVIYIYSIFDIYFVSPVVHGMRAYQVDAPQPPARRLVLYVGKYLTLSSSRHYRRLT